VQTTNPARLNRQDAC